MKRYDLGSSKRQVKFRLLLDFSKMRRATGELQIGKCSVQQAQLLERCASIAGQLLYAIRVLTVTISVHTVTNMYGSHSC
jgi:hypothetical protein